MAKVSQSVVEVFERYRPVFTALGDETRQQIMFLLASNEQLSVAELTAQTSLSRPAVSHHLKVLKDAGLVRAKRSGVRLYYRPRFQTPYNMAREFVKVLGGVAGKQLTHSIFRSFKSDQR